MNAPVVLYQLGQAPPPVARLHGEYASWFEHAWGAPLRIVDGRAPGARLDVRDAAGLIVSGSSTSLVEGQRAEFADDAAEVVRAAHAAGTPTLGVCYGHQLVAWAFGARVVEHPRGWEIGSREIELTLAGARDPLFEGLAPRLRVNLVHRDEVVDVPTSVRVLARNDHSEIQALAIDEHVWGLQFHPEISGPVVRAYAEARRELLAPLDVDAVVRGAGDCPDGVAVFRAFRRLVERA